MTLEEAIALIDTTLKPDGLNDLQEHIFREAWFGKKYQEIASESGYDHDYIRSVGFQLWQLLSTAFGQKINKNNFRTVLRQQANASHPILTNVKRDSSPMICNWELPEGPVSLESPFYLQRPPIEENCYAEVCKPGALIRLKAPNQMGKTSLKNRILNYAEYQGYHTVRFNFEQAEESILSNLYLFLRWFCANISRQLKLPAKLDDYWDEDIGNKVSCTLYLQSYLLDLIDSPLIVALDEVNRLFEYPEISQNFLPLLRYWYEEAKDSNIWQKLRLIVVHSTEIYVPLDINQSPFNVGLSIRLPEFTVTQVEALAQRHGLNWSKSSETEQLMSIIGGHPYRVRLALYHLASQEMSLTQLLEEAPTLSGIYSHHLREQWTLLKQYPILLTTLQQILEEKNDFQIHPIPAYKLESMGLIKLRGNQAFFSCELYRRYFSHQLSSKI